MQNKNKLKSRIYSKKYLSNPFEAGVIMVEKDRPPRNRRAPPPFSSAMQWKQSFPGKFHVFPALVKTSLMTIICNKNEIMAHRYFIFVIC